jgi:hypothetical protein
MSDEQPAYNSRVRGRYQIVFSNRGGDATAGQALGFWSRFKAVLVGVAFLVVAVAVLTVGLIFGSILAVVLGICLALLIAIVILKATWRGVKPGQG